MLINDPRKYDFSEVKVIIYWSGFNSCALRVNSLVDFDYSADEILIISDDSYGEFEYIISSSKFDILLDTPANLNYISDYNFRDLRLFVQTGWFRRDINKLGKYLKQRFKTKIIVSVDNIRKNSFRQFLGRFYFYFFFDKSVDRYIVPGLKSFELLKYFRVKSEKIYYGYYGAVENIFMPAAESSLRTAKKNQILFVGEFSKRKGVDLLLKVINSLQVNTSDWELVLVGKSKDFFPDFVANGLDWIHIHPFKNPIQVAQLMRESKIFVLPSRLDHWGTVVCEAAMSGCALLVSHQSGSHADLVLNGLNGFIFDGESELKDCLARMIGWDSDKFESVRYYSRVVSTPFATESYYRSINL